MALRIGVREILDIGNRYWFWLSIFLLCVALEGAALFYQHVLNILPCEICIYVRVWLAAIALLALLACFLVRWRVAVALIGVLASALSVGLAMETWRLIEIEYELGSGSACSFFANFPAWAPLDKWMPGLFEVQELCQATPSVIFGITMAEGLILVSVAFIIVFALSSLGAVIRLIQPFR